MKTNNVKKLAVLLGVLGSKAFASEPGVIQIFCGDSEHKAVEFEIYPLKKSLKYTTYLNGVVDKSKIFYSSPGIYNQATLSISGGDFYNELIFRGSYRKILRTNTFSSVTVALSETLPFSGKYKLKQFSDSEVYSWDWNSEGEETPHPEYLGLECEIPKS